MFLRRSMVWCSVAGLAALACVSFGQPRITESKAADSPDVGAFLPAQAAVDALRAFAQTDGAFIGADQVKTTYAKDNLASLLEYPADTVVVLNLTGTQLKEAFERSLSLYPQANPSFLQLSGFEVTFSKSAQPNSRVLKVSAGGAPLDEKHVYSVAMPLMLGNGILGYFKIWDKSQITKTYDKSIETVLAGKAFEATSPRWLPQ